MKTPPTAKKLSSISAFFPAYNDVNSIAQLIKTVDTVLPDLCDSYEIIGIDDSSRDGTSELLDRLCDETPSLRVIHHRKNLGYGAALRSGFSAATKDWVFYTDGDGQYDPHELVNLVAAVDDTINVVNGYKLQRSDKKMRVLSGNLYRCLVNRMFRIPVTDVDCDFRLISRQKLSGIELTSRSGAICVELIKKLELNGCVFKDIPINHYPRQYGRSQFFRVRPILSTFWELIRLYHTLKVPNLQEQL